VISKAAFMPKLPQEKSGFFYFWDTYRFDIIPLGDRSSTVLNATTIIINGQITNPYHK
jgi:hypothetical protein